MAPLRYEYTHNVDRMWRKNRARDDSFLNIITNCRWDWGSSTFINRKRKQWGGDNMSPFWVKKMYSLDEEKIECALGNGEIWFWQGKKAENVFFYFWSRDSRHLFVFDCQIQTTRLIMFFAPSSCYTIQMWKDHYLLSSKLFFFTSAIFFCLLDYGIFFFSQKKP